MRKKESPLSSNKQNPDENNLKMANAERDKPQDIKFDTIVVDLCCHPAKDVVASGLIEGDVTLHSYSLTEDSHLLMTLPHHKKACRCLRFSPDGSTLYTVSKDKSVQAVDMDRGAVKHAIPKAHKSALYSLLVIDENIIATGDDDGHLKVWDMRQQKSVMEVKESEEFISDMDIDSSHRVLIATSGEGTLTSFDVRKHKMKMQSELFDSELLSLATIKNGQKVVCGTGDGTVNIFNWNEFGNISDRFPGHPDSIDCMVKITENIICTGSIDGIIRAVNIHPNRFVGVVGEHDEFPVENLSTSHCNKFLASCSHDQKVKFWNISDLPNQRVSDKKKAKKSNTPQVLKNDFFSGLVDTKEGEDNKDEEEEDDSEDEDSDMDSDEDEVNKDETSKDNKDEENEINESEDGNSDDNEDEDDLSDIDEDTGEEEEEEEDDSEKESDKEDNS